MKKLIVILLLSIAITGCGNDISYMKEVNNDVDAYILPKGMKFVSYDNYMGKITIRKVRPIEESETYYVYDTNGECVTKFVEQ